MNIEETKEAIKVMQAFVDGKTIQYLSSIGWRDVDPLSTAEMAWLWGDVKYRIKPEPKDIWVNEYERQCDDYFYHSREAAEESAAPYALRVAVRYREVIEE